MENEEKKVMNLTTYDWEENMIDEFCKKYNINDTDCLNIVTTTILNEVAAMSNNGQCMLKDMLNGDMGGELIKREILKYINSLDMDQLRAMAESMAEPSENKDE